MVPVAVKPAPNVGTEPPAADRPMPRIQRRLLVALIRCVQPGPGPAPRRHKTGSPSYPTSDLVHGWDMPGWSPTRVHRRGIDFCGYP